MVMDCLVMMIKTALVSFWKSNFAFFSILFLGIFLTAALAQNPNGALRGEVQDASGARVSGAQVVVTSAASSLKREVSANDRGEFRIEGLLPGPYRLSVAAKGFAQATA